MSRGARTFVDRYSFTARDLHPLVLAGLPALHEKYAYP
jgi:hypothetical protein